ncbi:hypothetical protein Angca_000366, partial [Angiostrongylus cantonensis]
LWCHEGEKKIYSPKQCPEGTMECFKFTCHESKGEFVARGCGVSLLTSAVGLPNESCYQALQICQGLFGTADCRTCSDKHMCNSDVVTTSLSFSLLLVIVVPIF